MSVTPEIEAEILQAHAQNPKRFSPFRCAKAVGATIAEVIAVVNASKGTEGGEFDGSVRRTGLQRFVVASRRVTDGSWDNKSEPIIDARRAYEAGTHTMATHREGGWLHLCLFPLARARRAQPGYFTGGKL